MTDHPSRRRRRSPGGGWLGRSPARRAVAGVLGLAVVVVVVVAAASGFGWDRTAAASTPPSAPESAGAAQSATASLPAVATATPSAVPSAPPAAIVADRIRIARVGIDLRIVEGDGIDAPMNLAAHYPGTGWPDGGTNIYIYAHAQTGMFLALWDVVVGDDVVLDLIDGTTRTYVVTVVKPRVAWNALHYLAATPTEQLTLQTSTSYTPTAPRYLVIAEPAP